MWDVKGMLCSKFGEDRSKSGLTILAVVAGWTDTGRTDGHAKVNLYSVQCYTLRTVKCSKTANIVEKLQFNS